MNTQRLPKAARNDVEMHMRYRLACRRAIDLRDHDARHVESAPDRGRDALRGANTGRGSFRREIENGLSRLPADYQNVTFGLRHEIHEGHGLRILVDAFARQLIAKNASEHVLRIV